MSEPSWWSQQLGGLIERGPLGSRLLEGRAAAAAGRVVELSIEPGRVRALVLSEDRAQRHSVGLMVPTLGVADWGRVEEALVGEPAWWGGLLGGYLPEDIDRAFDGCKHRLMPRESELGFACHCADWASPCAHAVAAFTVWLEQLERDPLLLFSWRGRPRQQLLERVRGLRGEGRSPAGRSPQEEALGPAGADFWEAGALPPEPPASAGDPAALLRSLGPTGLRWRGRDLADWWVAKVAAGVSPAEGDVRTPGAAEVR